MTDSTATRFGDRLRSVCLGMRGNAGTDGEVLAWFVRTRNDLAFAELVRRLGPMVHDVCRRVLGPGPDSDDAAQAAFLVLARKADSVSPPGRVAAWTYGVAMLAARKARRTRRSRARREGPSLVTDPPATARAAEPDLGHVLAEEIDRLPEKYRLPVVLCLVRELTAARAGAELGWPAKTVSTRLARGRAILGVRLIRSGLGLAILIGSVGPAAGAGPPPEFLWSVVRAATDVVVPARVLSLSAEVSVALSLTKLRLAVAVLILAALAAVTGSDHGLAGYV